MLLKSSQSIKHGSTLLRGCRSMSVSANVSERDSRCRASRLLQPLSMIPHGNETAAKSAPKKFEELTSKSQRLLADLGFVRPMSNGTFTYMNLALRSLEKLTSLTDVVMEEAGCQKILLPTLTESSLWQKTGRYDGMKEELFKTKDKSQREYVIGPTHEEAITSLVAGIHPISYRSLPLQLYQISNKFRDEVRPKFGLIRGREFVMKDLYTFDADLASANETYERITEAYHNFFRALDVPYVAVAGSTGSMGGTISHEFQYPADIGQDDLLICPDCDRGSNIEVSTDKHIPDCPSCQGKTELEPTKAIEVGHTFLLGDKYSKVLGATYMDKDGKPGILQMGCYGLGLSRILAASVEILSTDTELRWPDAIVPFTVCIICPKPGSKEAVAVGEGDLQLYDSLVNDLNLVRDVILDDRDNLTVGKKLREALKTGYRFVILFGKQVLDPTGPKVELHCTKSSQVFDVPLSDLSSYLQSLMDTDDL